MINAKSLRVGNWLKLGKSFERVYQIIYNRNYDRNDGYSINHKDYQEEYFEPIELTPEIFRKCGFKKTIDGYRLDLEDCYLIGDDDEVWQAREFNDMEFTFTVGKKYLHQLQNLYYNICEKELEINL